MNRSRPAKILGHTAALTLITTGLFAQSPDPFPRLPAPAQRRSRLIARRWQLTYTQVWRTREFKTQHGDSNKFGSLTLSRTY